MANYRERDREKKAAAAKENTIFLKAASPTRRLFTDKKKSLFVTVKTIATCYGLESHYPPTRIFVRVTCLCLSLPCHHFILPFPLSLPFFSCFFTIIIVTVIIRIHIAWTETTGDATTEIQLYLG